MKIGRVISVLFISSIAVVLLWLVFVVVWNRWIPPEWKYRRQMARVEALVHEIEAFRVAHGRLPTSTEILHDQMRDSVLGVPISIYYFVSDDSQQYEVGLFVGFDEWHVYKPATRKWLRTD